MRILEWLVGVAVLGLAMIVQGFIDRRDGMTIGGSIIIGSAVIALTMLGTSRK